MIDQMSTAERLRIAAKRLREVSGAATPGPWEADPRGGVTGRFEGMTEVISESSDQSHADYIAAMHPPVALALADWLDDYASTLDCFGGGATGRPHSGQLPRTPRGRRDPRRRRR